MSKKKIDINRIEYLNQNILFESGVLFAINKFQEFIAKGSNLAEIEKEANKLMNKINENLLNVLYK